MKWDYKGYVRKALDELRNAQVLATVEEIDANVSSGPSSDESDNEPSDILDIDAGNASAVQGCIQELSLEGAIQKFSSGAPYQGIWRPSKFVY